MREFFEMSMLGPEGWFIAMLTAALGLVFASLMWRLPIIQSWEAPAEAEADAPPMEK